MQKKDFFLCGFTGWCLEILWTGLHSLVTGHFTMMGKTSLLMFPVYGLAALIRPAYYKLARFPVMVRGIIYSCGILGRNIHHVLDSKLDKVQRAMEQELAKITLEDVKEEMEEWIRKENE